MSNWLDELMELEKKATPGSWKVNKAPILLNRDGGTTKDLYVADSASVGIWDDKGSVWEEADAVLIASLRNSAPRLMRIAKAAEKLMEFNLFDKEQLPDFVTARAELRSALEEK